jgi:two-component system response regulator AtoC
MVAMSSGGEIGGDAFTSVAAHPPGAEPAPQDGLTLKDQLDALERSLIAQALSAASGNQSEAARRLGMSRSALLDRLKKYGFSSTAE